MTARDDLHLWSNALEAFIARSTSGRFTRAVVLAETSSTQDAARRLVRPGEHGLIVTTGRQTAGRGRFGRRWADTDDAGLAVTITLPPRGVEPPLLSLLAGIAVAETIEALLPGEALRQSSSPPRVGIKWPNDVLIDDRKAAGVLVEVVDDLMLLGIGINVTQTDWPPEIAPRAAALAQIGASANRLAVLLALLERLETWLDRDLDAIEHAFAARDVLTGRTAAFRHDGHRISGRILRIDPVRGLLIETSDGTRLTLPALTTSMIPPDESAS